jgi:small multidrug resistance pump
VSWFLLALGIVFEVAGTLCMKLADGFRDVRAASLMYILYALSLTTLMFAFRRLDVSVGYAVWSGAGIVLITSVGMLWFREPATAARLIFIGLILAGLVGLHLVSAPSTPHRHGDPPNLRTSNPRILEPSPLLRSSSNPSSSTLEPSNP